MLLRAAVKQVCLQQMHNCPRNQYRSSVMILTRDSCWWIAGHRHAAIVIAILTNTWVVAIVARLVAVHLVFHIGLGDVATRWQLICTSVVHSTTVRFYTQRTIQLHSFSSWTAAYFQLSVCQSFNAEYRPKCKTCTYEWQDFTKLSLRVSQWAMNNRSNH